MSRAMEIWYYGLQNMAPGGPLCHGRMMKWEGEKCYMFSEIMSTSKLDFLTAYLIKNTNQWVRIWTDSGDVEIMFSNGYGSPSVCIVRWMGPNTMCHMCRPAQMQMGMRVCMPTCLALQIQSLCIYSTCVRVCMTPACVRACGCLLGCLGAWGAGGALQRGLGEASGEGSDAGVCQRGGREQLVPAADCCRQVQVLQKDLGHSHEALVVHTPVIPPHNYLQRGWGVKKYYYY